MGRKATESFWSKNIHKPSFRRCITTLKDTQPEGYVYKVDWEREQHKLLSESVGTRNIWITNGRDNRKIYSHDVCPDGWVYGKTIRNKCINRKPRRPNSGSTSGRIAINNGINNSFIFPDSEIPEGWAYGIIPTGRSPTAGKIFINDGIKNKLINKDSEIPHGYVRGKLEYK